MNTQQANRPIAYKKLVSGNYALSRLQSKVSILFFVISVLTAISTHAQSEIGTPFEKGAADFNSKMKSLGFTISGASRSFWGGSEPRKSLLRFTFKQDLEVTYLSDAKAKLKAIKVKARQLEVFDKIKSFLGLENYAAEGIQDQKDALTRYTKDGIVIDMNPFGVITIYSLESKK